MADGMAWVRPLMEHFQRQALVKTLHGLSDHLLEDVGLRRDQIDRLRLPTVEVTKEPVRPARRRAPRPSLQGCG